MEPSCVLCGKTVEELAEEELGQPFHDRTSLKINLKSELAYPYPLCDTCEDFLCLVVPKVLETQGIIAFDEKADRYKLTIK